MCRMGDEFFKQRPEQSELPPILPVVFYQGERAWLPSTEFADLFPAAEREQSFLPRFTHYLIDQSALTPEQCTRATVPLHRGMAGVGVRTQRLVGWPRVRHLRQEQRQRLDARRRGDGHQGIRSLSCW
ncbi:MAG: Rpn family recombination-promoting nuclease/putative transposase [Caldilinea sp.]|nr:Rpn family recombination-promoting nuclease/putative transposase [Caldilinea sp.]